MSVEPSDGVFRYYWSTDEELEYAYGPFDSVDEATAAAKAFAENHTYGPEPGETVYIVRADKRTTVAPEFDIEAILDAFMEKNEDCWGENGWDGLTGDVGAAESDLQQMLQAAFTAWEIKHRDKINTWMFGRIEEETSFVMPELTPAEIEARVFGQIERTTGYTREQVEEMGDELAALAQSRIDLLTTVQAENAAEKTC